MPMEEAQKKAQRDSLPINDNWLAAFATSSLLLVKSFTNDRPEWDRKQKSDQTWRAWKDTFNPLHKDLERKTRLARGLDSFVVAAAAQTVHNIFPTTNLTPFHRETRVLLQGANLAGDFDAHFNNLVTAATHGNKIFQGTINHIARSTTIQHSEFKKLLAEIKSAFTSTGGRNNDGGGGVTSAAHNTVNAKKKETLNLRITQLQMAVKRKWIHGGFCSTHSHGVVYKHDSKSRSNKATGHVNTETRKTPAIPGTNKNKGWYDWLLN